MVIGPLSRPPFIFAFTDQRSVKPGMGVACPGRVTHDADILRDMIAFAAERLLEMVIGGPTSAPYGEKSPSRPVQRACYRERDCPFSWVRITAGWYRAASRSTETTGGPEALAPEFIVSPSAKLLLSIGKTGAGEEIRTLDPNLGKVVLYH